MKNSVYTSSYTLIKPVTSGLTQVTILVNQWVIQVSELLMLGAHSSLSQLKFFDIQVLCTAR